MNAQAIHRLPAQLEAAVHRLKLAARSAAERTVESLGLTALGALGSAQRQDVLDAQAALDRKAAVFVLAFNEAFDARIRHDLGDAPAPARQAPAMSWDALSLVEDHEVETQIAADRFAQAIASACEWELRELDAYVGSLLGHTGEGELNPLRPAALGHALIRGVEAVSERPELRRLLCAELGRSLAGVLRDAYADIVGRMRSAGLKPLSLTVRQRHSAGDAARAGTEFGAADLAVRDSRLGSPDSLRAAWPPASESANSGSMGKVEPSMMALMRRLAHTAPVPSAATALDTTGQAPLPNLIRAHRGELREASRGALDHMVIDVIASIFEQILADPKVPPQVARQLARLQLPVLRAALGDNSFFASRRHPVRRFVNRIASLGAAFDDFTEADARQFLDQVRALVQEIVDGDFDQIQTYEAKLATLEAHAAALAQRQVQAQGLDAELLAEKEDQLRLRALYAQQLDGALRGLTVPPFLHEFVSRVWSEVLLCAAELSGPEGELTLRLKATARELCLSVQPKPTPAYRKAFLAELPQLMQSLNRGMDLIAWPEAERRAFFGNLMPAHAQALKSAQGRQLDFNLVARQLDGALARPLPSREDLATARLPVPDDAAVRLRLRPEEARAIGLVEESAVDWDGKVDIDIDQLAEENESALGGGSIGPLPAPTGPPEPTHGPELADHVQVGFAYLMNLGGEWHKVKLANVSPQRTFFVFTRGRRNEHAMSMTYRMLVRLCEANRLRAFESAYLIERATARARRQLAQVLRAAA